MTRPHYSIPLLRFDCLRVNSRLVQRVGLVKPHRKTGLRSVNKGIPSEFRNYCRNSCKIDLATGMEKMADR